MRHLFSIILILSSITLYSQPLYIAHRGASYLAPENTISSTKLAWKLGADAVEIDIHLSKDNKIMVMHDDNTQRTTTDNKNMSIRKTHSSDLRKLNVGKSGSKKYRKEKIPYLSEIIRTIPKGKKLIVEIKCGKDIIPFLKEELNKSKKRSQISFISFGWETIIETKKAFPNNKCYWLSYSKAGFKNKIEQASAAGLDGLDLSYNLINSENISLAKKNNLDVLVWTVDDPLLAKKMIDYGIKGLTTNRPQWLKQELSKQ